ncbi:hypothetical protein [Patulibacter defluvii]|uniref:hypothetical protein n=1 Tax=Patulibacter defluvii TaxID=3095358 RepID=UPI002A7556D1|nr:hypothetical protein [Patulibacter sp. DM4]
MADRRRGRRVAAGLVAALALTAASAAPAAAAAETTVPSACRYSFDGFWRNLDLRWSGDWTPAPVAPGGTATLRGASFTAELPAWMPQYGYNAGLLKAGDNEVPVRAWAALATAGATRATTVVEARAAARTRIAVGGLGEFRSATPFEAVVRLPATTVTAGAGPRLQAAQAAPASLPRIPGGDGAAAVTPAGSVFLRALLENETRFDLDCQPGRFADSGNAMTPGPAAPAFAQVAVDPSAKPEPAAAPIVSRRAVRARGGVVRVAIRNPGAAPATVAVSGQAQSGGRWRTVARGRATIAPATTTRVRLRLTTTGRALLRRHGRLRLRVTARTAEASGRRTISVRG